MDVQTMQPARVVGYVENRAPLYLPIQPVGKKAEREWYLCLDGDILELQQPDRGAVLQVHRDEAARYVSFASDLRWGRTVSFSVLHGLRSYKFRCTSHVLSTLLGWLPNKSEAERRKEVRYAGIAVILFGVAHLLLGQPLSVVCGGMLIVVGTWGLAQPQRRNYVANGMALLVAGLWGLFSPSLRPINPHEVTAEENLIPVVMGSLLVLWGIQQFAMLRPNETLRAARAERDRRMAILPPRESRLIRRLGLLNGITAVIFVVLTALVPFATDQHVSIEPAESVTLIALILPRLTITAAVAVLSMVATLLFLAKKHPAYSEARASGQFLVSVAVLTAWSIGTRFFHGENLLDPSLTIEVRLLTGPYAWACLIACIILFNRWFMRAVDRELEEQRDA